MRVKDHGLGGLLVLVATGMTFVSVSGVGAGVLTTEGEAGKQIYKQGASPRGLEITALVGSEMIRVPASAVPCAGCHGYDGLGRPEGGVIPPDIRWSHLTKAYGHVHDDGRSHGAFDSKAVASAVTAGVDPAGNRLDPAMPVYSMSEQDLSDLIAYLKQLETDLDPGVEDTRLQVATLLPLRGPGGELGQAMAQVLHAFFQELNAAGGIYGRRIELLAIPLGDSVEETLDNLHLAMRREGIFALVGAYTVGLDRPLLDLLRVERMPLVGPFTLDPGDETLNEAAFYVYPGFAEQAKALVDEALGRSTAETAGVVVAAPEGPEGDGLVKAVQDQMKKYKAPEPVVIRYAPGSATAEIVEAVQENRCDVLFFFGNQTELDPLLPALAEEQQTPRVFSLSSLVSRSLFDAPGEFDQRIFLAFPTLASDVTAAGRAEYQELTARHALPVEHIQGQMAAYAAAKLFAEGVKRSGRDISRIAFVDALESLYAYDTGVTPPLSYGPNRRVGARGAHVVAVDLRNKRYLPIGGWHEIR